VIDAGPAAPSAAEIRRGRAAVRTLTATGAPLSSVRWDDADWCSDGAWREIGSAVGATAPAVDVRATGEATAIESRWTDHAARIRVTRTLTWGADGTLAAQYTASHAHTGVLPFDWGLTMPVLWSPTTRLELPVGGRAHIAESWGAAMPAAGTEFVWPTVRVEQRQYDLSSPTRLPKGHGLLCYVELPRGQFAVRTPQGTMDVAGTPGVVTHARVFIDHEAPLPGRDPARWWQRRAPQRAIVIGPAIGAPARVDAAATGGAAARRLTPGTVLQWDLTIRSSDHG
jgi:hypothetical protein